MGNVMKREVSETDWQDCGDFRNEIEIQQGVSH
jgi:hypothetical protein